MGTFFPCFKHITASDIDSETATAGHVPTADGSGGTAWAAQSGGGATFAFDGATFTPDELVTGSGRRNITVELTLGGAAITSGTVFVDWIETEDLNWSTGFTVMNALGDFDGTDKGIYPIGGTITDWFYRAMIPASAGHVQFVIALLNATGDDTTRYISVFAPTGAILSSTAITIPATA